MRTEEEDKVKVEAEVQVELEAEVKVEAEMEARNLLKIAERGTRKRKITHCFQHLWHTSINGPNHTVALPSYVLTIFHFNS